MPWATTETMEQLETIAQLESEGSQLEINRQLEIEVGREKILFTPDQREQIIAEVARREYERHDIEMQLCARYPEYFLTNYYVTLDRLADTVNEQVRLFPRFTTDEQWQYMKRIVDSYSKDNLILVAKSRRMLMTLVYSGLYLWESLFLPARYTIVSRQKEKDSQEIIKNVRESYHRLPEWIKERRPTVPKRLENKSEFIVKYPLQGGEVIDNMMLAVSASADEGRGGTLTGVLADELAFQENAAEAVPNLVIALKGQSATLGNRHFVGISTVNGRNDFHNMVYDIDQNEIAKVIKGSRGESRYEAMPGLQTWKNRDNQFRVFRVHYTAHPMKRSDEWKKFARAGFPTEDAWKREMEIDFGAGAGMRVFPIFTEKRHTAQGQGFEGIQYRSNLPIYRCWDFGYKKPAALITQIGEDLKWYILAELQGKQVPFYIFRSLIFHVCGVLERIYEEPENIRTILAQKVAAGHLENYRSFDKVPVFAGSVKFYDAIDLKFGRQHSDKSGYDTCLKLLKRVRRIDPNLLHIKTRERPKTEGIDLFRQLLEQDRVIIDAERCPILVEALESGYVFSERDGAKELPSGDNFYTDLVDCARYGAVNFFEFQEGVAPQRPVQQFDNEAYFSDKGSPLDMEFLEAIGEEEAFREKVA